MAGSPTEGIKTVLHPVSDLAAAKAVYSTLLGMEPQTDESYYVGFEVGGQHVGLVPGGGPLTTTLGPRATLGSSGLATVMLGVIAGVLLLARHGNQVRNREAPSPERHLA